MRKIVEKANINGQSIKDILKNGFFSGIGWAFGATVGFTVISTILATILRAAGGLPFVGGVIASIVQATLNQLVENSPLFQ
ncbi:hypothetical protein JXA63_05540 [Candidatus Woesebacteria bacterium]|nr:hypothetical protein [Candidatus Woesebacteria bacterium]